MASERAKRIRQRVIELRTAPHPERIPDDPLDHVLASASLPEIVALVVHLARSEQLDEVEHAEVFLRALTPAASAEELQDWSSLLQMLGYIGVSRMMRRLCRSAPSRPPTSIFDKAKARQAARKAELAKAGDTIN